ncbi:uncharacterized protein YdhG (YjbR/CyaY superfamily) [Pedobacter sp. W3I1]|nr:uncharacterized protein YdhG (YjbR/CyaY superfamily) [Pedobacter sp. W3I1]
MQMEINTPEEYLNSIAEERKVPVSKLRDTILENLPKGFEEKITYGMLGYVIPLALYPAGYHCTPQQALPFINVGSQKNFIVMHHLGLYAFTGLLEWFQAEYPKHCKYKLDMGKGCVRFKKPGDIPYALIAELIRKVTPEQWIEHYEKVYKRNG